jgi:hypothetical protein
MDKKKANHHHSQVHHHNQSITDIGREAPHKDPKHKNE